MSRINAARATFEPLRSLGFAGIGAAYAAIGTPLLNPARIIKITNNTDANLLVSTDGVTDHDIAIAQTLILLDVCANNASSAGYMEFPKGMQIFVKQETAAPTSGNIYVTTIYAA